MTSIKQIILLTALAGGASSIWIPGMRAYLPEFITGGTQASSAATGGDIDVFSEDLLLGEGPEFQENSSGSVQSGASGDGLNKGGGQLLKFFAQLQGLPFGSQGSERSLCADARPKP